ncbi:MAG TPA: hypothetical protein VH157_02760 [Bryobacteraceae bacterium]|nr:hypothetical protein [Bryobacteraceae bacterium]
MVKRLTIGFASLALAVASAATSYNVTFFEPVVVNGTTLKPGEYKVEINNDKATLKKGKAIAESPVKVESNDAKYPTTSVRLAGTQVEEIHVGGTRTKLVFEKTGVATN